jgi:proline iminopeptidase
MRVVTAITLLIFVAVYSDPGKVFPKASSNSTLKTETPVSEGYLTTSDGVRLFYRRIGRGKNTAICVHGGPGLNIASGCLDTDPLAQTRSILMYDQRGGGRSELVSDPKKLAFSDHVRDLESLRQHFNLDHFTLIGFSWGAQLAALYAMQHPERVERLLLVAPAPPAKTPFWQQRIAKITAKLGSETAARVAEIRQRIPLSDDNETIALCRELRVGYRAYLANPANERRVRDRCNASPASIRNGVAVSRVTLDSLGDWDFRPRLAQLTMPVLVIEGAETEVPLEATREWARVMPNARMLLLPKAGHELWAEQPEAFLKASAQFLRGRYPKGAEVVH